MFAALAGGDSINITKDASATRTLDYSVASVQSCQQFGTPVVRTLENRFITNIDTSNPTDLTSKVEQALGLYSEELSDITAFASDANNMLIRTATQTVCISLKKSKVQRYAFGSETALLGFSWGRCFVRDTDGKLIVFSTTKQELMHVGITNATAIQEIICGRYFTIILMHDGSAFIHEIGLDDDSFETDASKPFDPVIFPKGVSITKIRSGFDSIIYISSKGLCYYTNLEGHSIYEPEPLLALKGHKVNDIFISDYAVMVMFGKGRICMLRSPYQRHGTRFMYCLKYGYLTGSTRPISLPFFDGKSIAHVAFTRCTHYVGGHVFFTAVDGSVYTCEIDPDVKYGGMSGPPAPTITRVSYFDQNPVAVPTSD